MDGSPKSEVERILEYQRRMYNEKLKHLQLPHSTQTNQSSTNFQPKAKLTTLSTASSSSASLNNAANNQGRSESRPNNKPPNFKPTPAPKAKAVPNIAPKKSKTNLGSKKSASNLGPKKSTTNLGPKKSTTNLGPKTSEPNLGPKNPDQNEKEGVNCPTCKKMYGVYIYQCSEGHSSCKECKLRSANCGLCSKPITEKRNFTLETYLAEKIVACPNTVDGCWFYFKLVDMETHLKECPFDELSCPVEACAWRGKLLILSLHFDDAHPEHRQGTIDTEMLIPIKTNTTTMHLVEVGPYNFIIRVKIDEKSNIYMVTQLFGTCVSASKWNYKFKISNGTQMYEYSDVCLSNNVTTEEIYNEAKCAVLPVDLAMNFVKEDCLAYKFFLQKDKEVGKFGYKGATCKKNLENKLYEE